MKARLLTITLLAASTVCSVQAAPAPLPRPDRGERQTEEGLQRELQQRGVVVLQVKMLSHEGITWAMAHVRMYQQKDGAFRKASLFVKPRVATRLAVLQELERAAGREGGFEAIEIKEMMGKRS